MENKKETRSPPPPLSYPPPTPECRKGGHSRAANPVDLNLWDLSKVFGG